MPIPSDTRVAVDVQIAPDADLTRGPLSWPWVSLDTFVYKGQTRKRLRKDSDLTLTSGRTSESNVLPQPAQVSFFVNNEDGAFTPGNPLGEWYPNLRLDTPVRIVVPGSTVALVTDGDTANNLSTADHPSLRITGDIDLRYDGDIDWFRGDPSTGLDGPALVGRYKAAGNNRSYLLWIVNGRLQLSWSTAGTSATALTEGTTIALPWAKGRHAVRGTLDVSNAGNHVITFYVADTLAGPWTQLDQITVSGITSIHAGTAVAEIGVVTGEISAPPTGRTFGAEIRDGIGGSVVAGPNISAQTSGVTSFVDGPGRTWTVQGNAEITNLRTRRILQMSEIKPTWVKEEAQGAETKTIARCEVTASGVLRRLQQGQKPLDSVLYRAETAPDVQDSLVALWPMEDESTATAFASPVTAAPALAFAGDWSLSSDSTLSASRPLPRVSGGGAYTFGATVPHRDMSTWMFTMFVHIPTPETSPAETGIVEIHSGGTITKWGIAINDAAFILRGWNADGTLLFTDLPTPTRWFDGWTQFCLQAIQDGANMHRIVTWLTIDGTVIGYDTSFAGTVGPPTRLTALDTAPPDGISIGHMSIVDFGDPGWLGWTDGANTGYTGEPAAQRIQRLCTEQGVPIRIIGDPLDSELMGPQRPIAFLDLLEEAAEADGGRLGEDADTLGLSYRTRASLYNQTPALILDHARKHLVVPFDPVADDQRRRTHTTVTRPDGASATYVEPGFDPETHSIYDESLTVNVETDGQLPDQAAWRVHLGSAEDLRYESLSTDLARSTDLVPDWLDLTYGDLVRATNLPEGHPPGDIDQIADHLTEKFDSFHWIAKITGTPGNLWTVGVIEDDELGRADTAGSQLTGAETATDTSWSVTTTTGPVWIDSATYASMFPFNVIAGGEEVTVTAITGTTSPQTFTVVRSVNDVVKAHTAGTSISLAHPMVAAL